MQLSCNYAFKSHKSSNFILKQLNHLAMKSLLILLVFSAIIFGSCSTAYKTGQTPDDVYYSPERPQREYVQVEDNNDRSYRNDEQYYEDRQIRMKVRNRTRWSELDDWYYYNNRYNYYSNYNPVNWNNPWSSYSSWNYYYNPYCPKGYVIVNPRAVATTTYNKPRTFNLNTYIPTGTTGTSTKTRSVDYSNKNSNNSYNTNSRRDAGSTLRDIFRGSGNSSNPSSSSNNNNNTSSSSSGSSSSSSSSGSSGGSAPVRKF
jgi:hypothetical protein